MLQRKDGADGLYEALKAIPGHPLSLLSLENEAIGKQLKTVREALKRETTRWKDCQRSAGFPFIIIRRMCSIPF